MRLRPQVSCALVLAAGRAARLRPLSERLPKCLVDVGGKPLLVRTIEHLCSADIRIIFVNLHHLGDVVRSALGSGRAFGVEIRYLEEEDLQGTAGAVAEVVGHVDGPFVVWYGDNLSTCDLRRLERRHVEAGATGTVALHVRRDVRASGVAEVGQDGRIVSFVEKPHRSAHLGPGLVNAGILIAEPGIRDFVPRARPADLGADVFPQLAADGELAAHPLGPGERVWWVDTPEDLERVQREFAASGAPR